MEGYGVPQSRATQGSSQSTTSPYAHRRNPMYTCRLSSRGRWPRIHHTTCPHRTCRTRYAASKLASRRCGVGQASPEWETSLSACSCGVSGPRSPSDEAGREVRGQFTETIRVRTPGGFPGVPTELLPSAEPFALPDGGLASPCCQTWAGSWKHGGAEGLI